MLALSSILSWFLFSGFGAGPQTNMQQAGHLRVVTDRNLYISGEQILFSAFAFDASDSGEQVTVLFAALLTPDGEVINAVKVPWQNNRGAGCLKIPSEAHSGYYYLIVRNSVPGPEGKPGHDITAVKVVNPEIGDIATGSRPPEQLNSIARSVLPVAPFTVTLNQNAVEQNQEVTVLIESDEPPAHRSAMVAVSVIPSGTDLKNNWKIELPGFQSLYTGSRLPFKGISLSGEVHFRGSDLTAKGVRVNLSLLGDGRDFMATETDNTGQFTFSLPPYYGSRDVFIYAEPKDNAALQVFVDNDFATTPMTLPNPVFSLDEAERKMALQLARNAKLETYYQDDSDLCSSHPLAGQAPFYDQPTDVIHFEDYVQLPVLEEYFTELPLPVKVKRKDGVTSFQVSGTNEALNFYKPLVLVDGVAVNQPDVILKASPNAIDRIEVIRQPYVKGNYTYGGVISIFTRKGNFGGIDLPASGMFIPFDFFQDSCQCRVVSDITTSSPDARNTVYWNGDLDFVEKKFASLSFLAPFTPGQYKVVVKAIDAFGDVSEKSADLEVKPKS